MAATPFLCIGHLLFCVNIPTVLLIFFKKLLICPVPYFNSNLYFIEDDLALGFNSLGLLIFLLPQDYLFPVSTNFAN